MSIINFRPEIWSAKLLVAARKNLVYGGYVNRDWEGEITDAGDTVRITSVGRPTIGTYVPNSTVINFEQVNDSQRTLIVDQAKYFAFAVDDVDARQAKGNVIPQEVDEAGYGFADVMDQYVANTMYTGIQTANQLGSISVAALSAPGNFYDKVLVPLKVQLDLANVPTQGRWVVVRPEAHGALLRDTRFVKVNEAGTDTGLRNGFVGRAAGFDISLSNNAPNTTGSEYVTIAGTNAAFTFAEQINKVEALRPQNSFSDAVKGLVLYGGKLVRPDFLASALVTVTNS
jgi:N4-gp56 family major capsid protein